MRPATLLIIAALMLTVVAVVQAQDRQPSPVQPGTQQDFSCLKWQIQSLRNAAAATDEATANLELSHAKAYQSLLELQQPC